MDRHPDTADVLASLSGHADGVAATGTERAGALASQTLAIAEYIARGIDHCCGDRIGLELEHFIVHIDDLSLVPYLDDPTTGTPGVGSILERLAPLYDERTYETQSDGSRHLIGLSRPYANITLEPGAQFEISIGPVPEIPDIDTIYQDFRAEIEPLLAEYGYRLLELGYHPTSSARNIPLIPKDRYRFMDEHFRETGKHGICMMRASASTQVSVDYASEADAVRKFRIANAIGPLLAFVTDNSPVFEGRPVGVVGSVDDNSGGSGGGGGGNVDGIGPTGLPIPARMARTAIWNDVDARRSMIAPHTFDEGFGFRSYAASLLRAPAIFTVETDEHGEKRNVWQGARPFTDALANKKFDHATIEHVLSLFFFDVRFKTYIEIRMADGLPIEHALAFAALIKGLFYDEDNLRDLEERLGHFERLGDSAIATAKAALRDEGYNAVVYQRSATEWLDELVAMAQRALDDKERPYLEPFAQLIAARTTLVDLSASL
jgi:glutamate--cysteine ligase